jgi:hypothetical protein
MLSYLFRISTNILPRYFLTIDDLEILYAKRLSFRPRIDPTT